MNGKEWKKKKGIPGRGFSKALPRNGPRDTSTIIQYTIGLTEFCVGECIASNLQACKYYAARNH